MIVSSRREAELMLRRERLIARSDELRGAFGDQWHALRHPGWTLDAHGAWRWLQANPQWVAGGAALLVVLRPGRVLRWSGRAVAAWQLWVRLRPLWLAWSGRRR